MSTAASGGAAGRLGSRLGLVALVVLVNALGAAPALLAGPDTAWFAALAKPGLYPPPVVFGVVWTLLFTLQAVALWLVVRGGSGRTGDGDAGVRGWGRPRRVAVAAFLVQFAVNLAWTPTFFGLQRLLGGLVVILVLFGLALLTAGAFARVDRRAALLLVPYLAWVAFAAVLNYRFWALNA
ncbi:TspO/MBR family protein [Halorarum halobium]|uniref:TspO/MBR family protein n=1 Tax=Halorarum halobium TaxID=3075121 RepID=UPI0028AD2ED0|nr:TspO/MBR family protein [Halobaculum sp. XH14]